MSPRRLSHRVRLIAASLAVALLFLPALAPAQDGWRIHLEGRDVTPSANPRGAADALLVDLTALAPLLGITVHVQERQVRIVDHQAAEWRSQTGEFVLTSHRRVLPLHRPLVLERHKLSIALVDAAALAGLEVIVEPAARRASLGKARPHFLDAPGQELQAFTLVKPAVELAQNRAAAVRKTSLRPDVLPSARERLRLTLGAGHVAGRDGALDAVASGTIGGISADVNAFVTVGRRGLAWYSGRASLADPVHRWRAEAGDLNSQIDGLRRGARASIDWSQKGRSSVALYLPRTFSFMRHREVALAFSQNLALTRNVAVSGELSTDGSAFASVRHMAPGFSLGTHYRALGGRHGWGAMGSYRIWQQVSLNGSFDTLTPDVVIDPTVTRGMFDGGGEQRVTYGIRVPMAAGSAVTLERRMMNLETSRLTADAMTFQVPFKRVRLQTRILQGERVRFGMHYHREPRTEVSTVFRYTPARWLNLNVSGARYFSGGRVQERNELFANVRLARGSMLHLTTWRDGADRGVPLRLRFSQQLTHRFDVVAEYGAFGAYQQVLSYDRPELSRFRIVVRRRFDVPTLARGGRVEGLVVDELARPVRGAVVRLGNYRTTTNEQGHYRFDTVPAGSFDLYLDGAHLPAGYASHTGRATVNVSRTTRLVSDFLVAPLNVVRGRVFIDDNLNGVFDEGEAAAGVLVFAGDRPTLTDRDGMFAFYNVEPGTYQVRLATERLPKELEPADATEAAVIVLPDRPVEDLAFTLKRHVKPVIFQNLP